MAEKDPLNASYFMVDVPGVTNAHFREASGFTTETNVITTAMVGKDGKTVQKQIPGIMKLSPITFKRGLSDNMDLWKWRKLVEEGGGPGAYGGEELVVFLGDYSNLFIDLDGEGRIAAMQSGSTGCADG